MGVQSKINNSARFTNLYLVMQIKTLPLLFLAFIVSLSTTAQSYEKQYDICSESLSKLKIIDSIYFDLLYKRNDCLAGSYAPNFVATTINNQVLELAKLKGKVVMLNFWFVRCQACIKEMPDLNKLAALYPESKVVFISFAPEGPDTLKKFLKQTPFNFKTVANSEKIRRDKFKLFSIWPYSILIDKEGKISKMIIGPDGDIFQYYKTLIDQLL